MDKAILELGVGGIFAIMVIKVVLDFLKNKKESKNGPAGVKCEAHPAVDKLHANQVRIADSLNHLSDTSQQTVRLLKVVIDKAEKMEDHQAQNHRDHAVILDRMRSCPTNQRGRE